MAGKRKQAAEASTEGVRDAGAPSVRGPSGKAGKSKGSRSGKKPAAAVSGKSSPALGNDATPTTDKGAWGVPGSKNDSRRCTATSRGSGERCKAAAIKGSNVCVTHGGRAPQVKKAARERLLELVDPALAALHKVLTSDAELSVKVRAALGILDRTGHGPGATLSVHASNFDDVVAEAFKDVPVDRDMSMFEDPKPARGRVGGGGGEDDDDIVDAEVVYDTDDPDWAGRDSAHQGPEDGPGEEPASGEAPDYRSGPLSPRTVATVAGTELDPEPIERYGKPLRTHEERLAEELDKRSKRRR